MMDKHSVITITFNEEKHIFKANYNAAIHANNSVNSQ